MGKASLRFIFNLWHSKAKKHQNTSPATDLGLADFANKAETGSCKEGGLKDTRMQGSSDKILVDAYKRLEEASDFVSSDNRSIWDNELPSMSSYTMEAICGEKTDADCDYSEALPLGYQNLDEQQRDCLELRNRRSEFARKRRPSNHIGSFSACLPPDIQGSAADSIPLVKYSFDPYQDFRDSIREMIVEKEMHSLKDLEELLYCYFSLNSPEHHQVIRQAFSDIWKELLICFIEI